MPPPCGCAEAIMCAYCKKPLMKSSGCKHECRFRCLKLRIRPLEQLQAWTVTTAAVDWMQFAQIVMLTSTDRYA
jgi:hypothetical protein